jgi:hypothetical protein
VRALAHVAAARLVLPQLLGLMLPLIYLAVRLLAGLGDTGPSAGAPALVGTVAALAAAVLAVSVARAVRPLEAAVVATGGRPGEARCRVGGDLPRQQHPDSAGRPRPRAPGRSRRPA